MVQTRNLKASADEAWAKTKPTMVNFAQFTLGNIALIEKDNAKAEAELIKTLQSDPTNAKASRALVGLLLGQQKDHPEKVPMALFQYARAASYDGPDSLSAADRATLDASLKKAYISYHGSDQGLQISRRRRKQTRFLPPI